MSETTFLPLGVLLAIAAQILTVALSASCFIKHATKIPITMTDILYLLGSLGFFGLMLIFIWACAKV